MKWTSTRYACHVFSLTSRSYVTMMRDYQGYYHIMYHVSMSVMMVLFGVCCLVLTGDAKSLTAGQQLMNPPLFRGPVITSDGRKRGEKNKRLPGAEGPPEGWSCERPAPSRRLLRTVVEVWQVSQVIGHWGRSRGGVPSTSMQPRMLVTMLIYSNATALQRCLK